LIDGVDVRDVAIADLRSQIGIVPQETFLFTGTIAENIAYGRPGATMEEIIQAAKAANAHDFIIKLPDGYETVVGVRGQDLSGGEKQRIAIARAILHNPKILILDEATASLDTQTERQIQEALKRLVQGRTTIAIATASRRSGTPTASSSSRRQGGRDGHPRGAGGAPRRLLPPEGKAA